MRQTSRSSLGESPDAVFDRVDLLVSLVAHGDEKAFAELYDLQFPTIRGIALALLRDFHQAEEVAQEVMLEIWRLAGRFDPSRGAAMGWITQIARTRTIDRIRHCQAARTRDQRHFDHGFRREFDSVEESVLTQLDISMLHLGLLEVTALQREAVTMAFFTEQPYAEIALALGIPLATLKTRVRDGLIRIRETISQQGVCVAVA
jgi:RNA polymerase sigma-70 factor (ECF subfamily)